MLNTAAIINFRRHKCNYRMEDRQIPQADRIKKFVHTIFWTNWESNIRDKTFKTKELSHQIGSARLSFASPQDMEKYLDITPGSVSVMGLMNDHDNAVRLLVDEDVLKGEWVGCHPCINTSSLRIKTKDMFGPVIKAMHHDMTVVKLTGEA